MLLLDVVALGAVLFLLWILIFQVLVPVISGRPLFPAFRKDPLTVKVAATRDVVSNLKEQNANLTELQTLLSQRASLEKRIAELESPPAATGETQSPKE